MSAVSCRSPSRRSALPTTLLVVLLPAAARASGFLLHEQSAEAVGRAGAVSASSREPAAVWFNPAALAFMPGLGASATTVFVRSQTRFSPRDGGTDTSSVPGQNVVPSVFAHAALTDRLALGAGVYAPFGLAVTWPDGWAGEQHSLRTRLWALAFTPVLAYRLTDRLALAGGASLYRGGVHFVIGLGPQVGGRADLEGGAWAVGGHLAALWRALPDRLHLGLTYHSRARFDFSGDADFSPQNGTFSAIFADQRATSQVTLPDVVTAAIMFRPRPGLEIAAEVSQVFWSTFDRLEIAFERPSTPPITVERGTRNPFTARLGAEASGPNWPVSVRAGVFLDQSATTSETLVPSAPDAHRLGLAAGAGGTLGRVRLDLAYLYGHFFSASAESPRTGAEAPPKGTYRTRLHAVCVTVTVR